MNRGPRKRPTNTFLRVCGGVAPPGKSSPKLYICRAHSARMMEIRALDQRPLAATKPAASCNTYTHTHDFIIFSHKSCREFINSSSASPMVSEEFHLEHELLEPKSVFVATNSPLPNNYFQVSAFEGLEACAEFLLPGLDSCAICETGLDCLTRLLSPSISILPSLSGPIFWGRVSLRLQDPSADALCAANLLISQWWMIRMISLATIGRPRNCLMHFCVKLSLCLHSLSLWRLSMRL